MKALGLTLLLLTPVAAAFGVVQDVREFHVYSDTESRDNAAAGVLMSGSFEDAFPFTGEVINHTLAIGLTYIGEYTLSSNGVWLVTLDLRPGGRICEFSVETIDPGGLLTGDLLVFAPNNIFCRTIALGANTTHTHDFWVNRTLQSGTPNAPTHEVISINARSTNVVILSEPSVFESVLQLTALEFISIIGLSVTGFYLWTREGLGARFFGLFLVGFTAAITFAVWARTLAWNGLSGLALVMVLLFGYMTLRMTFGWAIPAWKQRRGGEM